MIFRVLESITFWTDYGMWNRIFFVLQNVQAVRNPRSCHNNFHCSEIIFLVLALVPFSSLHIFTFFHRFSMNFLPIRTVTYPNVPLNYEFMQYFFFENIIFFVCLFWLHCSTCGILVPPPAIEPTSPALKGEFFTTGPWGKSL